MERESTGVKEIDCMIEGGIPKSSIIGVSGPPGVGKSIFSLHFLLEGAKKGEKCLYINLEEPKENIDKMVEQFAFSKEFKKYIEKEKIIIKCYTYAEYEKIYADLMQRIHDDKDINRLVIDSFNVFFASVAYPDALALNAEINVRKMIMEAFSAFRKNGLTTMLILETPQGNTKNFYYNIPHLVDGIISLEFLELGNIERRIFIPKMRWTDQYKENRQYEIGKKGIVVKE